MKRILATVASAALLVSVTAVPGPVSAAAPTVFVYSSLGGGAANLTIGVNRPGKAISSCTVLDGATPITDCGTPSYPDPKATLYAPVIYGLSVGPHTLSARLVFTDRGRATGSVTFDYVQSDLAVTITDGVDNVYAGSSTTYTITLTNHGPSTEPAGVGAFGNVWPGTTGAMGTAFDEIADGCVIDGAYWGCQSSVALAAGASRTYQFTASIEPDYLTAWGVTLPGTAWAGNDPNANDPNLANDLAWDYDIVVAPCTRYIDGDGGDVGDGEVVCGGPNNDSVNFVWPGGVFYGNGGDDTVNGLLSYFYGGDGNDTVVQGNGAFYGGAGNDYALSVNGNVYGEAGDDGVGVIGASGNFYGGDSNDTLSGDQSNNLGFNYGNFYGEGGGDTLVGDNYGTFDGGDGADAHVGYNYGTLISVP